jgi:triosephosphate isomerase
MPRRPLVAANWKMHLLTGDARAWCEKITAGLSGSEDGPEAVVFPSHPLLPAVVAALDGTPVGVGGQDLHPDDEGAHTGDVSGRQLVDVGCRWVLCGHSERRHDHGEGDPLVAAKVEAAGRHGLTPVLCLGETRDQRRAGHTHPVLERQLRGGLARAPEDLVVAYEPVWAIGTGETATPETAQQAHAFLRRLLAEAVSQERAGTVRILYGGSVKPHNAAELIAQDDIDGFLVGGASLDPEKFRAIIKSCH